ncbi:MAG: N-acetylmuramoyl-L-alanine amidase [Clostridia bacterium]|nr:N-acetylmuramoyl-L-alanine amidase [Clostridia bacterium]
MSRGIIVLDPGHGQFGNPHTTKEGFYEGTQNFILASFLKEELEKRGFEILMTRNRVEDNPELAERGELAGKNGAVLFLSIHSNAPSSSIGPEKYPLVRGVETYYSVSDLEGNAPIARALNDAVVKTMNSTDRGIKTRRYPDNESLDYYGVIRAAAGSGCKRAFLIEHGFHTNPEDSAFLQDTGCLAKLAAAEAEVIDSLF